MIAFSFAGRKDEASATFVLGAEGPHLFVGGVQHQAGDIGRLLEGCACFQVDPAGQAGDQVAALGIAGHVDGLQQDGDRLGRGFNHPAIFDGKCQCAVAARHLGREGETGVGITGGIQGGDGAMDLFAVDAGGDGDAGAGWCATLGAVRFQCGADLVAGAIAVAKECDLSLEAWCPVGADVKRAFRGRGSQLGVGDPGGIFAPRLSRRDLPGKTGDAIFG